MSERSPYLTDGPTLLSFSGGRISAFMLHETIAAHGGKLPDHVVVAFANTGKEREETLRFVRECGSRWGVRIRWVEWRPPPDHFEEVDFNNADRTGKWFAELIRRKQYLPNATMRYCTIELKIRAMVKLMRSLGHKNCQNMVGLRYDEGMRVLKALARNDANKDPFVAIMPLSKAKITKAHIMRFWLGDNLDPKALTHPLPQGFDLGLRDYEGNCDLCFLKARGRRAKIIEERPDLVEWWVNAEANAEANAKTTMPDLARFKASESYAQLASFVRDQGVLGLDGPDDEYDAECGLTCAA